MILRRAARSWPWLLLALAVVPAVWHVVDFESDTDPEYPRVERQTFSRFPPAAYRLAEPGDTIDRIALYLSAAAVGLSLGGWVLTRIRRRPAALWPAATAVSLAATWHAMTPGPTFDGWHGMGWRALFDPAAPTTLRAGLAVAAMGLLGGGRGVDVLCLAAAGRTLADRPGTGRQRVVDVVRGTDRTAASRSAHARTGRLLAALDVRLGLVCVRFRAGANGTALAGAAGWAAGLAGRGRGGDVGGDTVSGWRWSGSTGRSPD